MPRGAFVLASCGDISPPPSLSFQKLAAFATSLAADDRYEAHLVVDDRHCPTLCTVVEAAMSITCHGANSLLDVPMYQVLAQRQQECVECNRAWAWSPLLPIVLNQTYVPEDPYNQGAGGAAAPQARQHFDLVWVIEADVSYEGDWAELLAKYDDRVAPIADVLSPTPIRVADLDSFGNSQFSARYHSYLWTSRFSARLVRETLRALNAGEPAYVEELWATTCMRALHSRPNGPPMGLSEGCVHRTFDPLDVDTRHFLEPSPSPDNLTTLTNGLVLPIASGLMPALTYREPRLRHPVKWERLLGQHIHWDGMPTAPPLAPPAPPRPPNIPWAENFAAQAEAAMRAAEQPPPPPSPPYQLLGIGEVAVDMIIFWVVFVVSAVAVRSACCVCWSQRGGANKGGGSPGEEEPLSGSGTGYANAG